MELPPDGIADGSLASPGKRIRLRYSPQLDGLRAVAALAVLGVHSTTHLPGGYLGVQVFFVLSGYLIYSLLAAEYDRYQRVELGAFMRRRLARLYPALFVATCLGGVALALYPDRISGRPWLAIVSTILYFGNWVNFVHPESTGPLIHTWTLAIEWQFYVVAPFAALRLLSGSRRNAALWLLATVIACFGARIATGLVVGFDRSFFATWSQIDCIAIGCLLATGAVEARWLRHLDRIAAGALVLFLLWCLRAPVQESFAGQAAGAVVAIALAGAVILASGQARIVRLLSLRPLVEVGRRSYGIYLYHFPIAWMLQAGALSSAVTVAAIPALSIAAAWASFAWVETPARRLVAPAR